MKVIIHLRYEYSCGDADIVEAVIQKFLEEITQGGLKRYKSLTISVKEESE